MPQSETQPTEQPPWRRALPYLAVYGALVVLALVAFGPGFYEHWLIACVDDPKAPFCGLILDTAGIDSAQVPASPFSTGALGVGRFPQTSLHVLNEGDFAGLTCPDLRLMRNEIYARHGHIFVSGDMRDHFAAQPWYTPQVADATGLLTPVEKENIALVMKHEMQSKCR
jgi:hypothetical protein